MVASENSSHFDLSTLRVPRVRVASALDASLPALHLARSPTGASARSPEVTRTLSRWARSGEREGERARDEETTEISRRARD